MAKRGWRPNRAGQRRASRIGPASVMCPLPPLRRSEGSPIHTGVRVAPGEPDRPSRRTLASPQWGDRAFPVTQVAGSTVTPSMIRQQYLVLCDAWTVRLADASA